MKPATAYARYHSATQGFRNGVTWQTPPTAQCACCTRPWAATEDGARAAPYRYQAGMAVQWLCTTCYTPRLNSEHMLGVERMAGRSGKTVAAKLGMLPGSGGVITTNNVLYLAFPPGNMRKYAKGWLGRHGRLFQGSPLALLLHLHDNRYLGDVRDGIVFFPAIGRKAQGMMADLRPSTDWRCIWCNTSDGHWPLNVQALFDLYRVLRHHDLLARAGKPAFWRPIQQAAAGRVNHKQVASWRDRTPGADDVIAALPDDPHDRLMLHRHVTILLQQKETAHDG